MDFLIWHSGFSSIRHDLHNVECQQQEENIGVLGIPQQITMQFIKFGCMTLKFKSAIWQPCAKSSSPHIKYVHRYSVNSVTIFLRIKRRCTTVCLFHAGKFYSQSRCCIWTFNSSHTAALSVGRVQVWWRLWAVSISNLSVLGSNWNLHIHP